MILKKFIVVVNAQIDDINKSDNSEIFFEDENIGATSDIINSYNSPISINFGDAISTSIDFAAEMDTYTFSAVEGDKILIRIGKTSGTLDPELRLISPGRDELITGWDAIFNEINYILTENEEYKVLAGDYGGTCTGNYGITIFGSCDSEKYTTPLKSGWNMISVPLNLTNWEPGEEAVIGDPSDVAPKNNLSSIYRCTSMSGSFEKCDHFGDWEWYPATGSEDFTGLEPGSGYYVIAKNECVWRHKI